MNQPLRILSFTAVLIVTFSLATYYASAVDNDSRIDAKAASKHAALNLGNRPQEAPGVLAGVEGYQEFASEVVGVGSNDWGQWGGTSIRNNTPEAKNLPHEWNPGEFDYDTGEWKSETAENIKWVAPLGSQSYGNAVVANGKVYVGSNNGAGYLKRYPPEFDLGVLLCFDQKDGKFLWQDSSEKLPTGRVNDWPLQGICCAPLVEGDRLWYVTSRGEVKCLDAEGFYDDEDDGPVQGQWGRQFDITRSEDADRDEYAQSLKDLREGKIPAAVQREFERLEIAVTDASTIKAEKPDVLWTLEGKKFGKTRKLRLENQGARLSGYMQATPDDKNEPDVTWVLDMMKELNVSQHNMCSCSIVAAGDVLFINTSNGVDEGHVNLPQPSAPSFIAVDKNTGKVLWTDNTPGVNVLHGQWSSPAYAVLGGQPQVLFGAGDGWLYSYDPQGDGKGGSKILWKFDCNPKRSKYVLGGKADRNHLIATPVVYNGLVYIGVGEDPEHGEGDGHFWCIDPTKRGDVSADLVFNAADSDKPIPHKRNQACVEEEGDFTRPNPNSAVVWHYDGFDENGDGKREHHEKMHRTCGTAAIKDGLLIIADFSGLVHCLDAATGKLHWTHDMLSASWASPLIADGKVYIGDEDGDVTVFKLSPKLEILAEIPMGSSVYSTPIVADGVIYISTKDQLFAIEASKKD